jgi:signal transduction histidine kinase
MMNNLLEWSLFKRGLVNVKTESIPLFRIIDDTTEQMHSSAENKNISIKKSVPHDLFIITDKSILSIIIRNIISNSIKFTERGGSIKVWCEKYDSDKIKINIQDTGIGMSEEIRKNLFNVNRQSSRKGTEDEPSTGLGLLLVQEYTKKLNGTINVQSEPDKGSTFTITLPQL